MRAMILLMAAVLGLAGCGGDGGSGGLAEDLEGRTFRTSGPVKAAGRPDLVPGSSISVSFAQGTVSAQAGCNSMGGAARIDGDRLILPEGLMMTEMACDPPLMDQEAWVAELLGAEPRLTLSGPSAGAASGAASGATLTLTSEDVTLTLDEVLPASLVGTTWQLTAIGGTDADSPVSSVDGTSTLLIGAEPIGADGTFEVWTQCDGGGSLGAVGTVTVGDAQLEFGPAEPRDSSCTDPESPLMAEVMGLLVGTLEYRVEGQSLVLTSYGEQLVYVALPATAE